MEDNHDDGNAVNENSMEKNAMNVTEDKEDNKVEVKEEEEVEEVDSNGEEEEEAESEEEEDSPKVIELKEKMKQMVDYIQNYMKHSESNVQQLEMKHKKEVEMLVMDQRKLQDSISELEEENASFERQFEEAVQEYEDKISALKEERKIKNQENIDNLSTLVTELTNIEEVNASLTQELEDEKLNSLKITEELELSRRIIIQMEVKIANQTKELAKQSNQVTVQSSNADQSDVVKHLMRKLEKIGEMANELKNMAVPDSNTSVDTVPLSMLEEERSAHKETKRALDVLKGQSTLKNLHKLQNQVNRLLVKSTDEQPLSPVVARRTLVSTRLTKAATENLSKSIEEEEEKVKTKELIPSDEPEKIVQSNDQITSSPNLSESKSPKPTLPIPMSAKHNNSTTGQNILVEVLKNTPPRERKSSFSKSFLSFGGKKDKGKRLGIIASDE